MLSSGTVDPSPASGVVITGGALMRDPLTNLSGIVQSRRQAHQVSVRGEDCQ